MNINDLFQLFKAKKYQCSGSFDDVPIHFIECAGLLVLLMVLIETALNGV